MSTADPPKPALGEFDIIARYLTRAQSRPEVLLGIGDDAAVLATRGQQRLVVAMDTLVSGVHFLPDAEPADIGYRALAVNLSDIAAMGGEAAWMTLSLSLPSSDATWLDGFASGLFDLADQHNVALVGGDTVRGPLVITVQIAGWVDGEDWLRRDGAAPGDRIYVSGLPGEAAAGLQLLKQQRGGDSKHLVQRFLRPTPRLALGGGLRGVASAAMDVSDGLLTDLRKLCAASDVGASLKLDALPPSTSMQALFTSQQCIEFTLSGGDDYELLFTVAPERVSTLAALSAALAVPLTCIGEITAGQGVRCELQGSEVDAGSGGYDHFKAG